MSCSCGVKNHKNQVRKFPKGTRIVAITEVGNGGVGPNVPFGSTGRVTDHCDDGRAWIAFDVDDSHHTFHAPERYIAAERVAA